MTGDRKRGFTLIELLVAMGLFVIVLGITSAIFIRGLRSQKTITSLIAINDNASLALEQMAREIRTGTCFELFENDSKFNFTDTTVGYVGDKLSFTNARGNVVDYKSTGGVIEKTDDGQIGQITSADVDISRLQFIVFKPLGTDGQQVRIVVLLSVGSSLPQLQEFTTDIQTTISPRILDTSYTCS